MKKLLVLIIAITSLTIISGCGNSSAANSSPEISHAVVDSANTNSVNTNNASPTDQRTNKQASVTPSDGAEYIGVDNAKSIALDHAGLNESEVIFITAELDFDDRKPVYDVEFYYENSEYDYEIDAVTCDIISYDHDIESYNVAQSGNESYITLDDAKAIALEKAALNDNEVTFTKAHLDYDDGRAVYDIKFISGVMEYEIEIDAVSGSITEYDADSKYD